MKGGNAHTEISPFEAKWDESKLIQTLQHTCQDKIYPNAYVRI